MTNLYQGRNPELCVEALLGLMHMALTLVHVHHIAIVGVCDLCTPNWYLGTAQCQFVCHA